MAASSAGKSGSGMRFHKAAVVAAPPVSSSRGGGRPERMNAQLLPPGLHPAVPPVPAQLSLLLTFLSGPLYSASFQRTPVEHIPAGFWACFIYHYSLYFRDWLEHEPERKSDF